MTPEDFAALPEGTRLFKYDRKKNKFFVVFKAIDTANRMHFVADHDGEKIECDFMMSRNGVSICCPTDGLLETLAEVKEWAEEKIPYAEYDSDDVENNKKAVESALDGLDELDKMHRLYEEPADFHQMMNDGKISINVVDNLGNVVYSNTITSPADYVQKVFKLDKELEDGSLAQYSDNHIIVFYAISGRWCKIPLNFDFVTETIGASIASRNTR